MHKNEFIRLLARESALSQKEVNQVIKHSIEIIAKALREGDKVVLTGFGTFEMRSRRERRGVNPQTKQGMVIPRTITPGFTASNSLKLAVSGKRDLASLSQEFEIESPGFVSDGATSPPATPTPGVKASGRRKVKVESYTLKEPE